MCLLRCVHGLDPCRSVGWTPSFRSPRFGDVALPLVSYEDVSGSEFIQMLLWIFYPQPCTTEPVCSEDATLEHPISIVSQFCHSRQLLGSVGFESTARSSEGRSHEVPW